MTTERKDRIGLSMNSCTFIGKVLKDPEIFEHEGTKCASLTIRTMIKVQQTNGQFVDIEQNIPLIIMDDNLTQRLVKPYIKAGKQIIAHTHYRLWYEDEQPIHGFIVEKITLGT